LVRWGQVRDGTVPDDASHRGLFSGDGSLFEDQARDELGLGRCVLDIVADGFAVRAVIDDDVVRELDGATGRQRADLDIEAIGGLVVAGSNGAKPSSGKALWTVSWSDNSTTRR